MKCEKCNIEMMKGKITGQHPFEIGIDGKSNISVDIQTGEEGEFLGIKYQKEDNYDLIAYICPNCKKIEFYLGNKK